MFHNSLFFGFLRQTYTNIFCPTNICPALTLN
nr:MAG TPA: hypothetical protein [Microviridae sp.]